MYSFTSSFTGVWHASNCLNLSRQCRPRTASSVTVCSTAASVASLPSWVTEKGGVLNDALDLSQANGASISSNKEKLMKGTELLTLPIEVVVTPQIARIAVQKLIARGTDISQFNDECMLAVFLLLEKCKGSESEYAPFIDNCPTEERCTQVFLWADEEIQLLEGSPVKEKALSLKKGIEEEWEQLNEIVFASNRDAFPEILFSCSEYLWAQAIILSHCVSGGSDMPLALAPIVSGLELPKIGKDPSCMLQYRGSGFFSKPRLVLTSQIDLGPGDAVSISSGAEMFNDAMLLEYGVVSDDKLACRIEMEFSIGSLDKFFEEKECILEQEDLTTRQGFVLRAPSAEGRWDVPQFMESFIRLVCLGGMDVFLLETIFEKEVWGHMGYPVSVDNERAMCECIIGACEDALEAYPVKSAPLSSENGSSALEKKQMVSVTIAGEREILEACKAHYVRHMASLDSFQYYHERRLDSLDLLRPIDESEYADSESGSAQCLLCSSARERIPILIEKHGWQNHAVTSWGHMRLPMSSISSEPLHLKAWFYKEGRRLRTRSWRFLVLKGSKLSHFIKEDGKASWEIDLSEVRVRVGDRPNEIRISAGNHATSFFTDKFDEFCKWARALKHEGSMLEDFYRIGEKIGSGSYSKVYRGIDKITHDIRAIKVIVKNPRIKNQERFLRREIAIMTSVRHENLVRTVDVFQTTNKVAIVSEFVSGGELFDMIIAMKCFTEDNARQIAKQILEGVQYLHRRNIVHRDIKPENILVVDKQWPLVVKITDFGLSTFLEKENNDALLSQVGTSYYIAPEVTGGTGYGSAVDIWACGVVLFVMLCGRFPFWGRTNIQYIQSLNKGPNMAGEIWSNVSDQGKLYVRSLLQLDPSKRPTVEQALNHTWVRTEIAPNVDRRLSSIEGITALREKT